MIDPDVKSMKRNRCLAITFGILGILILAIAIAGPILLDNFIR